MTRTETTIGHRPTAAAVRGEPGVADRRPALVGREVTCRGLDFFFRHFAARGLDLAELMAGVGRPVAHLRDRNERLEWHAYRRFIENFAAGLSDDELIAAGEAMPLSRAIRPLAAVARLLFDCRDFYRWNFDRDTGVSQQMFTCIDNEMREIGPGHVEIETHLHRGYAPCRELMLIFQGSLRSMPRILGLPAASVAMTELPDGARYEVRYPLGGGALAWLRRALRWPFSARALARGLKDARETAFVRSVELEREATRRRTTQRALSESDDRFFKAFHATPSLMIIAALEDGRFLDVNRSFLLASGYRREEVIGRGATDLELWDDLGERQQVIAALEREGVVRGIEVAFRTKAGEARTGLLSGVIVTLDGERCVIWQAVDITERKQAEKDNRRLEERILQGQKLESLGVLAGGIAHDFNNLLVGILGNADLALRELADLDVPERTYRRLEAILKTGDRAAGLTREILVYSGKGEFTKQRVDLAALVRETATLTRSVVSKKVALDYRARPGRIWVDGDRTQIGQVVLNLVTNAAEAYGNGGGTVEVELGSEVLAAGRLPNAILDDKIAAGEYAYIDVRDRGCGMDEVTRSRIFDPFFSTKFAGRGLGLASVLGIVHRHAGTLMVSSTAGEGTAIRVVLPMTDAAVEATPEPASSGSWVGAGRVLVVDDEEPVRAVAVMMVEEMGFEAIAVSGGAEAVAILGENPAGIVAVVLDMTMPGLDGEATFGELRRVRADIPVALSSGQLGDDLRHWAESEARVCFLPKPYTYREMRETLRGLLAIPAQA